MLLRLLAESRRPQAVEASWAGWHDRELHVVPAVTIHDPLTILLTHIYRGLPAVVLLILALSRHVWSDQTGVSALAFCVSGFISSAFITWAYLGRRNAMGWHRHLETECSRFAISRWRMSIPWESRLTPLLRMVYDYGRIL